MEVTEIVVGFHGLAGTGKTSTADLLCPGHQIAWDHGYAWNHLVLAGPLYEMFTIRKGIEGLMRYDRIRYQLHALLLDLLGENPLFSGVTYNELLALVEKVADYPLDITSDAKPRDFLLDIGQACRALNPDCFVEYAQKSMKRTTQILLEDAPKVIVHMISDVRMENEAQAILDQPHGMVIEFTAEHQERMRRLYNRDGRYPTAEHMNHITESGLDPELITESIDTTLYNPQEQAQLAKSAILSYVKELQTEKVNG